MRKKCIVLLGGVLMLVAVVSISVMNGEKVNSKDVNVSSQTALCANIMELPGTLSEEDVQVITLPEHQQYSYRKNDGTERLTLDVMTEEHDCSTQIIVGDNFICEPEKDDSVWEWMQNGMKCRLFGTFTEEELKQTSKNVWVGKNE